MTEATIIATPVYAVCNTAKSHNFILISFLRAIKAKQNIFRTKCKQT